MQVVFGVVQALPRADLGRSFWKLQLFERETYTRLENEQKVMEVVVVRLRVYAPQSVELRLMSSLLFFYGESTGGRTKKGLTFSLVVTRFNRNTY